MASALLTVLNKIPRGVWYILAGCAVLFTMTMCLVMLGGGTVKIGVIRVNSPAPEPAAEEEIVDEAGAADQGVDTVEESTPQSWALDNEPAK